MDISATSPVCLMFRGVLTTLVYLMLPLIMSVVAVRLVGWKFLPSLQNTVHRRIVLLAYGCAVFGTCVGLLTGWSKEPVAGAAVPALLTFLAGLIAYFFSRDAWREYLPGMPIVIVTMGFSISFGVFYAASLQTMRQSVDIDIALHKYEVEKQYIDSKAEFLKKAIENKRFDNELYRTLFGTSSSADFRFSNKSCQFLGGV